MEIRVAATEDAEEIRAVYAPYVINTAVSFEYDVPTIEEFKMRIDNTLKNHPYLVAIENDSIVGYTYASSFHSREAYKHSAELSVYIKEEERRKGIGQMLYLKLEEMLSKQNVYLVHACVSVPEGKDEHLTNDSEQFHKKMGFKTVGKHELCGYKFGKWYSIIWMDKVIKEKKLTPKPFIPFSNTNMQV